MLNYSEIARKCIGPGGAPYSRSHINEVMRGHRRCSPELLAQLLKLGVCPKRCAYED